MPNYTLSCESGTYGWTGQDIGLRYTFKRWVTKLLWSYWFSKDER